MHLEICKLWLRSQIIILKYICHTVTVIVPKKAEKPGEPPRRRLCVDYRAINKLLPTV